MSEGLGLRAPLEAELLRLYPAIADLPDGLRADVLAAHGRFLNVAAGARLFDAGRPCQGFPMVLSGSVRVARAAPNGRSLELYRVLPGEICLVSASSLFADNALTAQGDAIEPSELLLLSPAGFERLAAQAPFRRYVFGIFAERMEELMAVAEAVAFQRLDQRLAAALLGRGAALHLTHQALADELGTARENVTRLLRRFENEGWLELGRERIELRDPSALRRVAAGEGAPPAV
jgi:CRP/FNR family transcriptional regulator, anaerobic regulatory protein